MCALETLLKAFLKSRERTDAIKFAPIPSLNLCSRRSSPARLHTPYWRSPSAPNPRTLAMATLPAMRINASPTAMGRTPLLPFASGTRIEAVRSSTQLGGREAEEIREEGEGLHKHVMLVCPAASGLDEFEGPAARAGGRALRQALDSLKHVIPAAAEVLLTRYINSHGLDAGWVELL